MGSTREHPSGFDPPAYARTMTDSYRDQVVIELYENPDHNQVLDNYRIVIQPNGKIDLDWLNDALEAMFHKADENGTVVLATPYVLVQRRSETHWGAAGAQAQFFIETAAHIGSIGLDTTIGMAIGTLINELRNRGYTVHHGKLEDLTQDEIAAYGMRAVESKFGIPVSQLSLKSDGIDDSGQYAVSAIDNQGITYAVTFVIRGGLTEIRQSSRTMP